MPRLRLGDTIFLSVAVEDYLTEITILRSTILDAITEACLPFEDYAPASLDAEYQFAEGCRRIIQLARTDTVARISGVNMRDEHAGVFHAALLLKREALVRKLSATRATPLAPPEARRPLLARIALIDRDVIHLWYEFPVSESFERIRANVALREGGIGWQALAGWLQEQAGSSGRWWCFCDTNFFLESRELFSQVDWHTVWAVPRVVLVVSQAMLRELDDFKVDPRRERSRRRQRASKVLQILESAADAAPTGTPAPLRPGVEVLILDHEPWMDIPTLDPRLADDRLIAAALDFREHLPDEPVLLVSDDRGPRFKARRYDLERRDLASQRRSMPTATA